MIADAARRLATPVRPQKGAPVRNRVITSLALPAALATASLLTSAEAAYAGVINSDAMRVPTAYGHQEQSAAGSIFTPSTDHPCPPLGNVTFTDYGHHHGAPVGNVTVADYGHHHSTPVGNMTVADYGHHHDSHAKSHHADNSAKSHADAHGDC
jgi:hypothetical protein